MSGLIDVSESLTRVYSDLQVPDLKELKDVLSNGLKKAFEGVKVEVTQCPDLTTAPYKLEGRGLSPDLRILNCGGNHNFFPKFQRQKQFNLKKLARLAELPNGWAFGPGAAPREAIGKNAELVINANLGTNKINCHHGMTTSDDSGYVEGTHTDLCFKMFANVALCSNEAGHNVLKVYAKKRLVDGSFTQIIQRILAEHYPSDRMLCLAGVWQFVSGRGRFHVMPDYPEKDFDNVTDIASKWLKYFEFPAPMIMTTVIHNTVLDMELPTEHTHGFSGRGYCGHYHGDVTPDEAEYEGYFIPAVKAYKFD
ncbi:unnamed protein product [Bursaphelenchus okinawaensis]|uniref:DUF1907 domain-containing protein n=1 Tax=Bursaphelenchus okinawaensis TaxID=465554 RepID=A0A811LA74_9BILA|nr:unnamed protein product [Bursaphelenchus okinawaensis]CAG9120610.1 unnamed protein product [Bursaphelenchus okinawaensis]